MFGKAGTVYNQCDHRRSFTKQLAEKGGGRYARNPSVDDEDRQKNLGYWSVAYRLSARQDFWESHK